MQTTDRIVSSPLALNQVIYVGAYDYNLYALRIIDGSVKWKFKTDGLIKSSPVIYQNKVYFGSYDKYLYALDTTKGALMWKKNINGLIECSPVVNGLDGGNYNASISGA